MIFPTTSDFEYVCKLLFDTFKIPVKFTELNGSILHNYTSKSNSNPLHSDWDIIEWSKLDSVQVNFPILQENEYLENFILMPIQTSDKMIGTFIIGPTLIGNLSQETITGLLNDFSKVIGKQELTLYYDRLPKVSRGQLLNICKLLYFLVFNERMDIADIVNQNRMFMKDTLISNPPELEISKRRENQAFHPPEYYEIELMQCIRDGRKEDFLKKLTETSVGERGILARNSYLRSQKNLSICGITIATRAAIEGGLEWDLARTLSDVFIQNIEDATDVESVRRVRNESMYDFAELVQQSNQKKYSEIINQCFRFIYKNVYDHISVSQIAESIGISPVHLSARFKKEVGQTLSRYIQQEKVEESKKLIVLTDYSFLEICTLLNFNDQSYFTKVFKKITGLTPKQYKDRGRLI
ncbi:helix-turn-helix domain-containing protein [Metabacillus bambusae]|uniref:AraC family transcriptional regulator n=1 Tax=Metabacillus bambusae TaxID=2795218 RepID=A0ABS3N7R4_9BACI|nr:helix-turn-helix domain-containing protein [Metabacillus bambusae]MBO1514076.1 AraC family transcriptional regulator [Metabacillus bambusae]